MIKILLMILILSSQYAVAQNKLLEQYHWKNRIILLFGPDSDAAINKQITELESAPRELVDRDLLIFHISKDVKLLNSKSAFSVAPAQEFRDKYNIPKNEFRYILIGKDSGVKYDKKMFVPNKTIFAIIDAMPMRKREMRRKD